MKKSLLLLSMMMAMSGTAKAAEEFDFIYSGSLDGALYLLQTKNPHLEVVPAVGKNNGLSVHLHLQRTNAADVLRALGQQGGDRADVIYNPQHHSMQVIYKAANQVEQVAIDQARKFQKGGTAMPIRGKDGLILFPYGEYQATVTCAPLRICGIELQTGEVVKNVMVGDTARWLLAPAKQGEDKNTTPLVVVKPTEAGLETDLMITTNRRTYTLNLKSSNSNYLSRVGFYYPQEMVQTWSDSSEAEKQAAEVEAKRTVADVAVARPEDLNFNYVIRGNGDSDWKPLRVFSDSSRVFIQMPKGMQSAPSLVLLDDNGNSQIVNYRVKDDYYIVDKLFKRAALILGVGRNQQQFIIEIPHKFSWFSRND